jgi:hypothetical protein
MIFLFSFVCTISSQCLSTCNMSYGQDQTIRSINDLYVYSGHYFAV